ncbi:integral membrane sensor signal transduction histidine kinase [Cylindrospermum sp. NIES-4074]|nr:integral membrane sensor signal transduction histidine kinase [Cylindrospermum sp. NIES-4074]
MNDRRSDNLLFLSRLTHLCYGMNGKESNKLRQIFIWLIHLSRSWSIAKKISYGYTVIIGIAFVGTVSGLLIANHYEMSAQKQLILSYEQQSFVKDLDNAVINIRLHPQRLVTVLEDSIWLEFEKNRFLSDVNHVNQQLAKLENFVRSNPDSLAVDSADYNGLVRKYKNNTKLYAQTIKNFWQEIESDNSQVKARKTHQQKLMILLKDEEIVNINVKFEKLSDELILIIGRAEIQKQQAKLNFNNARNLRFKIIFGTVLLSSVIAIVLAFYTSNLIAYPLQVVTKFAKKVTQESNFQLRANVTSNDEVGILATSLNRLVEWVGEYTEQLELARKTLEHRVDERTQELTQALQDLKDTQGQLIQTEKMSSLGQMVAGIAHEINNPVNFIHGNIEYANNYIQDLLDLVQLYQQQYPNPDWSIAKKLEEVDVKFLSEDLVKILSSMKIGTQRIKEIVLSLRNFSRLDEGEMKEVDIHEGIDSTLLILNHRFKEEVQIIKEYGNLPLVECYPAQLNQVFMNILSNGLDALLEYSDKDNKQIVINTSRADENHIKIGIKDNGIGILPEIVNKLFDPFFTTKPVGKGTGLGLSISYQIIEKHQGKIDVISAVNQGTEFTIVLPIKTAIN